jgi:hypothetical protein
MIRRIARERAGHAYLSEAHATPSPDGTRLIRSSNWGRPDAPGADYVAYLAWPAPSVSAMRSTTRSH